MSCHLRSCRMVSSGVGMLLISAVLSVLALPLPVTAHAVTVGCGAVTGTYEYGSLTAALASLQGDSTLPHTVTVTGTCEEELAIRDSLNLTIEASAEGASIVDTGTRPNALEIGSSQVSFVGLRFVGVKVTNVEHNLVWIRDSRVTFSDCTLENAGGSAVDARMLSRVVLTGSTLEDNRTGVYLRDGSALIAQDGLQPTVIRQNQTGIWMVGGSTARLTGGTSVEENTGAGIEVQSSHLYFPYSGRVLRNGGNGITLNGGTVDARGSLIKDNHGVGIWLSGASGTLFEVTVEGNGGTYNTNSVGGVGLMGASSLTLSNSRVVRNNNRGVSAHFNSSVTLLHTEVSGNGTDGVRVEQLSSALVASMSRVTDNAGNDLFCSPDSVAFGPRVQIGKLYCPGFGQTPLPHWNAPEPEPEP